MPLHCREGTTGVAASSRSLIVVAAVVGLFSLGGVAPTPAPRTRASTASAAPPAARADRRRRRTVAAPPQHEGAAFLARMLRDRGVALRDRRQHARAVGVPVNQHATVASSRARAGRRDLLRYGRGRRRDRLRRRDRSRRPRRERRARRPHHLRRSARRRGAAQRHGSRPPVAAAQRARRDRETFLRAKRVADPSDAAYFAGQMSCGVASVGSLIRISFMVLVRWRARRVR